MVRQVTHLAAFALGFLACYALLVASFRWLGSEWLHPGDKDYPYEEVSGGNQ